MELSKNSNTSRRPSFFAKDLELKQIETNQAKHSLNVQKAVAKYLTDKLKRRQSIVDIDLKGPSELLTEAKVEEEPYTDFTMLI